MNELDYDVVAAILGNAGVDLLPAEFHGQVTGLWCRSGQLPHDLGIPDASPDVSGWDELRGLAGQIWRQLDDPECGYNLLLPDDDAGLAMRVDAMAEWCAGLLFGLAYAGELDLDNASDAVCEAIEDLTEISRIELSPEGGEEDEQAFAEIVEYLRVLAQTLYVELHPQQSRKHEH